MLKRNYSLWRILLGGFIGSLIILLAFTPLTTYTSHPISKLVFSIIMVMVSFGYKRFRFFITGLMAFYFTTFLIGGSLIGTHYFIQFDIELTSSVFLTSVKGFGDPISWLFVLLGFPIAWQFSKKNVDHVEMTKIKYDQIVGVSMQITNKQLVLKGLIDSGNHVYDPISRLPVMFISLQKITNELPKELASLFENSEEVISGKKEISIEWQSKIRIIPFRVMGKEHQFMLAIKPDALWIEKDKEITKVERGLVSFTNQQLSSDDSFDCIVHPKMLTGKKTKVQEKVS